MTQAATVPMFSFEATEQFIIEAVTHYEHSAPTVAAYINDLYLRLNENPDSVRLVEITTIGRLLENGIWDAPNMAANRIYHLMDRLGLDTTGHLGF